MTITDQRYRSISNKAHRVVVIVTCVCKYQMQSLTMGRNIVWASGQEDAQHSHDVEEGIVMISLVTTAEKTSSLKIYQN